MHDPALPPSKPEGGAGGTGREWEMEGEVRYQGTGVKACLTGLWVSGSFCQIEGILRVRSLECRCEGIARREPAYVHT
jgi:hypothetical protein